jgi:hypothetical protein
MSNASAVSRFALCGAKEAAESEEMPRAEEVLESADTSSLELVVLAVLVLAELLDLEALDCFLADERVELGDFCAALVLARLLLREESLLLLVLMSLALLLWSRMLLLS